MKKVFHDKAVCRTLPGDLLMPVSTYFVFAIGSRKVH